MIVTINDQLRSFILSANSDSKTVYMIGLHDNLKPEVGEDLDGAPVAYGKKLPEWMWFTEMTESSVYLFTRSEDNEVGLLACTLELQS